MKTADVTLGTQYVVETSYGPMVVTPRHTVDRDTVQAATHPWNPYRRAAARKAIGVEDTYEATQWASGSGGNFFCTVQESEEADPQTLVVAARYMEAEVEEYLAEQRRARDEAERAAAEKFDRIQAARDVLNKFGLPGHLAEMMANGMKLQLSLEDVVALASDRTTGTLYRILRERMGTVRIREWPDRQGTVIGQTAKATVVEWDDTPNATHHYPNHQVETGVYGWSIRRTKKDES